jgi:regulator of sigma D
MKHVAHCTNLAVLSLSGLPMVKKLEALCNSLHSYVSSSPKWYLEFSKLTEVVETSGLKILGNVKTRWILLLEPMKHVLLEYKTLIVKMNNDAGKESKAAQNLSCFCDVHTLLAFPCVYPLLKSVNPLIKFA